MSEYVTAIDFGSSKIAIATGEMVNGKVHVIYYDAQPVVGIRNGEIQNDMQIRKVLDAMLDKAESETGTRITEAITNISGKEICTKEVSVRDTREEERNISEDDVANLTGSLYNSCGVYEVAPQKYNVYGTDTEYIGGTENEIIGMRGTAIEGFCKVFSGKESLLQRRKQILDSCGVSTIKGILSAVASARAVLTAQDMNNGIVLVDIGKGTTDVAIIKNNIIRELTSIPFGGDSITNDICTETNLAADRAEELKIRYGCCLGEMTPENKTLELIDENGETEASVQYSLLTAIIEARVSEIFDAVRYIIDNSAFCKKLPAGVVITGGSAYLGYLLPLARAILERKCRLDAPRVCVTDNSAEGSFDASASTAVGMIVEYFDRKLSTTDKSSLNGRTEDTHTEITEQTPAVGISPALPDGTALHEEAEILDMEGEEDDDKKEVEKPVEPEKPKKPGFFTKMFSDLFGSTETNDNA